MKVTYAVLSLALFSQTAIAAWGLSNAIYNKWHETELERWLADHNIPYPAAADRKELQNLVKENWEGYVVSPYQNWDTQQQAGWLKQKGINVSDKQAANKDWLAAQIKKKWYETESSADDSYGDTKSWVFDSWTDSQLKSFLDYHGIPSPKPRNRDSLLSTARSNYATISNKAGETAAYPGDWLYKSWSDSDLKKWLDEHGYPAPQGSKRNELTANVRRNSRQAQWKLNDAKDSVYESTINAWSDSDLKAFFDKNNIAVPQNGKRDELVSLARKNKASITGDTFSASVTAALTAASASGSSLTSKIGSATDVAGSSISSVTDKVAAGTDAAKASVLSAASVVSDNAAYATDAAYDQAVGAKNTVYDSVTGTYASLADSVFGTWSDSRLKAFLDSRGVPVPQNGKKDELVALARLHKYKAANKYNAWTFDTWTRENLLKWLKGQGHAVQTTVDDKTPSRDQLVASASSAYDVASTSGGSAFASVTSALAQATDYAKDTTFDTWSESDLKAYLDSYGVKSYQGTTKNELIAKARRYRKVFDSGWHQETAFQKYQRQGWSLWSNVMYYAGLTKGKAEVYSSNAASSVSSAASSATSAVKQEL